MDTKTILSKIKKYKEIHPQYEIDEKKCRVVKKNTYTLSIK